MLLNFYYDETERVAFYSEGLNKVDKKKFKHVELSVTQKEFEKMKAGYLPWIRNGQLVLEKTSEIERVEKEALKEELKKALIEKAKDPDVKLKDILVDYLIPLLN